MASIGVGITAYLAAKVTPKTIKEVEDKSKFKYFDEHAYSKWDAIVFGWKNYIPAIIVGAGTIACIFTSHEISKKERDAIIAAYALLKKSYDDYRDNSRIVYGEDAEEKIFESISSTVPNNVIKAKDPAIVVPSIVGESSTDFSVEEEQRLFYDVVSERYFESTIGRVLQAQYHLNRNFTLGAPCPVNDYYEFLGIPRIDGGDKIGWGICDEIMWIDFNNYRGELSNGISCLIIEPVFWPTTEFLELWGE